MPRHSPAPQRPPLQAARQSRIAQRGRLGKWLAIIGAIAALASPFTFAPATAQSTPPATLAPLIGANLPAISDYSPTPVYVDLVRQARRFGTAQTPWDEKAILAPDGWPMGDFGIFLMTGMKGIQGIPGTYKVTFTGQANVEPVASNASIANLLYDPGQNRTTLDVILPQDADQLVLAFTGTRGNIKNLRVIRPGYDPADPPLFTREFLKHIARFQTLRFMEWLETNGRDGVTTWASRTDPARTHYAASTGTPWEDIVALANLTKQDIWINIPIRATDDYIEHVARLLRETLNGQSRIYVEYSNEIWNAMFTQFGINVEMAVDEVRRRPDSPLAYDGQKDKYLLAFRRVAQRLKDISDIFRRTFGNEAMMTRVRPVFSGQIVRPALAEMGLDFIAQRYGPPSNYFYAFAGAPYFNLGKRQTADGLTPADVLDAFEQSVRDIPTVSLLENNLALAAWYGLPFIAYEGGSDTFGPGSIQAKKQASMDPRLLGICHQYLTDWYSSGAELFMWFTAGASNWGTQYGTWGLTTDLAIENAPKIRCIDEIARAAPPASSARHQVPGSFDAMEYVGNLPPYKADSRNRIRYMHPKSTPADYLVFAAKAGDYSLVLRAEAARAGNVIAIGLNNKTVAPGFELKVTGWDAPGDNSPIPIHLEQGLNTIRISTTKETSGFGLTALTIR